MSSHEDSLYMIFSQINKSNNENRIRYKKENTKAFMEGKIAAQVQARERERTKGE